jgi:hypothetical protein
MRFLLGAALAFADIKLFPQDAEKQTHEERKPIKELSELASRS